MKSRGTKRWRARRHAREAGFSLLEAIVAVAIVGLAMVVSMQGLSTALRSEKRMDDMSRAVSHAQFKMNELYASLDSLEPQSLSGDFGDGFRWTAEIAPAVDADLTEDDLKKIPIVRMQIRLQVSWPGRTGEKSYLLTTLKNIPRA